MSRSKVGFLAGLALAAAVAVPGTATVVQAQDVCVGAGNPGCTINTTASLTIPRLFRLAINADSITLAVPTWATDSLPGLPASGIPTTVAGLLVSANTDWELQVSTAAANFVYNGTEGGVRAASTLEVEATCSSNSWTAISGTPVVASSGSAVNNAAGSLCLRTVFPASYASLANRPGVYQLAVDLTLAAP